MYIYIYIYIYVYVILSVSVLLYYVLFIAYILNCCLKLHFALPIGMSLLFQHWKHLSTRYIYCVCIVNILGNKARFDFAQDAKLIKFENQFLHPWLLFLRHCVHFYKISVFMFVSVRMIYRQLKFVFLLK